MEIGISNYNSLINNLKERKNISLEITKKYIDLKFSYRNIENNLMTLFIKLQNLKKYIVILKNINSNNNNNNYIPFEYSQKFYTCSKCQNEIQNK